MKIASEQNDDASLTRFGLEVIQLIKAGDYEGLADRFGYALAFGKNPGEAIRGDVTSALGRNALPMKQIKASDSKITIRRFKPDDKPFIALVECELSWPPSSDALLAELILTTADGELNVTLEQIS